MYQGKVLCERHVHRNAEHGDLLRYRFVAMMGNDDFHDLGTLDKANMTVQKQMLCADAQC